MDKTIALILRIGVAAASLLVLAGAFLYLRQSAGAVADYRAFHADPYRPHLPHGGHGLIQLGLVVLILTPVGRVVFSLFAFARQHDRAYIFISSIVLALLLFSLIAGTALP